MTPFGEEMTGFLGAETTLFLGVKMTGFLGAEMTGFLGVGKTAEMTVAEMSGHGLVPSHVQEHPVVWSGISSTQARRGHEARKSMAKTHRWTPISELQFSLMVSIHICFISIRNPLQ